MVIVSVVFIPAVMVTMVMMPGGWLLIFLLLASRMLLGLMALPPSLAILVPVIAIFPLVMLVPVSVAPIVVLEVLPYFRMMLQIFAPFGMVLEVFLVGRQVGLALK